MGAWGYGYKENDNYYNEAESFVEPLIDVLVKQVETGQCDLSDFRARLMWTVNTLKATKEDVVLSDYSLEVLYVSIKGVRENSIELADSWVEPAEYLKTVEAELASVEEWLSTFKKLDFLEDRIGAIAEAILEKDEQK